MDAIEGRTHMGAFAGECRIQTSDGTSVRGTASLTSDQPDSEADWGGRLRAEAFDFSCAERDAQRLTISLPSGATGTVKIAHFTYLLPTQAHVTGIGPPPW
jgi:hypothetical protein